MSTPAASHDRPHVKFARMADGPAFSDCERLGDALTGDIGDAVEKIQKLILRYYDDVREQAASSFTTARRVAIAGFVVLLITLLYVIAADVAVRFWGSTASSSVMTVGQLGLIAGFIVEALAGTQFWLHSRTTKQFGAFHICLERTHRYVLAYKIADTIRGNKDATLEKIVCIMANAPMITREDIDGLASGKALPDTTRPVDASLEKAGAST
jgi:hypothetical protein